MKKEFIKLSGILCAITLVAAMLLAGVNHITKPKIAEAEEKANRAAMKKILPQATSFEQMNENVFMGTKDGKPVGFCVNVTTNGYGGAIGMMVAIDDNAQVCGIEILSHSETAGLGAKATEPEFKNQFSKKNPTLEVVKTKTESPDQITAITGATVTSRAVASGVDEAFNMLLEVIDKEGKSSAENN